MSPDRVIGALPPWPKQALQLSTGLRSIPGPGNPPLTQDGEPDLMRQWQICPETQPATGQERACERQKALFWSVKHRIGLLRGVYRLVIGLIQRVNDAKVSVNGKIEGVIGPGMLVLVAVKPSDSAKNACRLAERVLNYRIFADEDGRMNLSLLDKGFAVLAVPQFTLAADTAKGARPSFSKAAAPETANALFDAFVTACRELTDRVETGVFGADMQVTLCNDGPVTFWLEA